ncbi:hypothetical protein J6253_03095 [bacterium]|nr:hypothetical protein [bacterium]MBP5592488.1 hypothetical protein [bacterium]
MKKKIFILALMISFILPAYADTVFFMKPVTKEIEKSDANKIIKNLESTVSSKLNSVSYKDVSKAKLKKFGKCGMKPECWSENAGDEDFQYVLLSLISMNEDEEVTVRLVLINIEDEEVVDDESKTYDYADDANEKAIFSQIRKMSAFSEIKGGKKSKKDEVDKRTKKLEEERKKRERELERQREEEERLEKERKKRERMEEERQRREEEAEIARLEKERAKKEAEKKKEQASKKKSLKDNAEKLERAHELVLEMCSQGKYNAAIKAIVKVSEIKCECEEDAKVLALKTQLLNFNKVREQILKGVEAKNSSLILDNIEAAKALDESIVPGGTEFSQKVDKYAATGWLARGKEMEKANNYVEANEAFEKCAEIDPEKTECSDWLNSKDKLVKAIYDKASVMKNFNPTKAKELLRAILKLVTAENEHYKKAEQDLQQLEY